MTSPFLKISAWLILSVLLLSKFTKTILAISITLFDAEPASINEVNQEFKVNLKIDAANVSDSTIYYLRGVLFLTGSTNYCGINWNGTSWFNGPYSSNDGWKNLLKVQISSHSASAKLRVKIDTSDSGCRTNGEYKFKVQRYTEGGSASFDDQNIQTLAVSLPTSAPTALSSPTLTRVPTMKPTEKLTNTAIPTVQVKRLANEVIINDKFSFSTGSDPKLVKKLDQVNPSAEIHSSRSGVLGTVLVNNQFVASITSDIDQKKSQLPILILMGTGSSLLLAAVILSIKKVKN